MKKAINIIESYREMKGLSYYKIEKKAGIPYGYLSKMVRNNGNVGSDILTKIANAFPDINFSAMYDSSENIPLLNENMPSYTTREERMEHIEKRVQLLEKYIHDRFFEFENYLTKLYNKYEKNNNADDCSRD
jgi:transcriptional regulator with XRE-family HTH domain